MTFLLGSLVRIPEFNGGSVTRLDAPPTAWREEYDPDNMDDRDHESCFLDQELVLSQIPVGGLCQTNGPVLVGALWCNLFIQRLFPNTEIVEFQDQCLASTEDLRRLRDRLPRLEHFDHDLVVQDVTDMREAPSHRELCYLSPVGALARMFGV